MLSVAEWAGLTEADPASAPAFRDRQLILC